LNSNFDSGSFAGDGWTVSNGTQVNQWVVGTAAGSSSGSTGNAAYISNDGGVTNAYTVTATSVVHFYQDVTVPVGESVALLTFDLKGLGESTFDYVKVYLVPTTTLPISGTELSSGQIGRSAGYNLQSGYTKFGIWLPASAAGTTQRLVFSWRNDSSAGTQPPAAIDNIRLISSSPAGMAGTYTIDPANPTDWISTFNNISDAVLALNAQGVTGPVTFTVPSGQIFSEGMLEITTTTGSAVTPIVFQKSGAGANPVVRWSGFSSSTDAVLALTGADYVTIDGLDMQAYNPTGSPSMEYGYLVRSASSTNGAQYNTIQNTAVVLSRTNTSSIGILQTSASTGGGFIPTAASGANSYNAYYNFNISNTYNGIYLLAGSSTAGLRDTSNQVGVIGGGTSVVGGSSAGDIGGGSSDTYGVRAALQDSVRIFNVEVRNLLGTSSGAVSGIWLDNSGSTTTSVGTNEISNNQVHDLNSTSTSAGVVYGLRVNLSGNAASVSRVYNNFVHGLNSASTSTTSRRVIGIAAQDAGSGSGATHNIDFNSVYLAPAGLSTNNTCFQIGTTSGPVMKVRNNIFANFTGAQTGSAKHYAWVTTSSTLVGAAGSVSNYNVLHVANPTNGYVGLTNATDQASLANWQTAVSQDANSWSQDPRYVSATNLHISTTLRTPVESNAVVTSTGGITVSVDIDGEARSATTPDIGADEGTFLSLLTHDISPVAFVAPTTGGVILQNGTFTPTAIFNNAGTSTETTIPVRFRIEDAATVEVYSQTTSISTLASGAVTTTLFPNTSLNATGVYTMYAIAELATDEDTSNDQIVGTFQVKAPLSGTYTIGSGGHYATLTVAVAELNALGVSGPVIFSLTDASYGTGETFPLTINVFGGASANNTVTFKPASGVTPIISGASTTAIFRLFDADYVIIDGSNTAGGTSRDLTIVNGSSAAGTAAIWLSSNGAGLGATYNTIKHVNLAGGADQSTGANNTFGIFAGGTTIGPSSTGADNDYNTYQNNAVTTVRYGIFSAGASAANPNAGTVITRNLIGPAAFGSTQIGKGGVVIYNEAAPTVANNEIRFVGVLASQGASGTDRVGIALATDAAWTPTTAYIANASVTGNSVHDIVDEKTFSAAGIVVAGTDGVTPTNNLVANNMIAGVRANGTAGDQGVGLGISAGVNDQVVFNSIYLSGDIDPGSSTTATQSEAGIRIASTTPASLTLNNNAIKVDVNSNTTTLNHYAIVAPSTTYSWGAGGSNNNDFYPGTTYTQTLLGGIGTTVPYSNVITLGVWQGIFTGQDAQSVAVEPQFASTSNLHLAGLALDNLGTPLAVVTTDFDGDVRSLTTPEIGADEITTFNVTFIYNDLEDAVKPGDVVWINGSFVGWSAPVTLTADGGYTTFSTTLALAPGVEQYKYIVNTLDGYGYDLLNNPSVNRVVTITGSNSINEYRRITQYDYYAMLSPAAATINLGAPSPSVLGEMYINNLTAAGGALPGLRAQVGFGQSTDPSTWTWNDAAYAGQSGNNDQYSGVFTPTSAGVYSYAVRFNANWGAANPNSQWVYGGLGFAPLAVDLSNAGVITVTPAALSIIFTKTVGTDPNACAATQAITVPVGQAVTYCYAVTNNGQGTLTTHTLTDTVLGTILNGFSYTLAPEATVFVTQTVVITQATTNVGYWTADDGVSSVAAASSAAVNVLPVLTFTKTVGTDPNVCAATSVITVPVGTEVTYCYAAQNTSLVTLTTHTLTDTVLGTLFTGLSYDLAPAATTSYTTSVVVTQTTTNVGYWTASEAGGTTATVNAAATVVTARPAFGGFKQVANSTNVVSYTIVFTNTGGVPGTATTLSDVFPAGTTGPAFNVTTSAGSITNNDAGSLTWSGSVAVSERVTITFVLSATAGCGGTVVTNTAVISDPIALAALNVSAPPVTLVDYLLNEGFESATFPPAGWTRYNPDNSATQWARNTTASYVHSGVASAYHFYGSAGTMEDGWLVSPPLNVAPGTLLSFWEYTRFPSFYYQHTVWICTGGSCGAPPTNYTQLAEYSAPTAAWRQQTIDLNAYANQTVQVAWRYEGDDADAWYIDDVQAQVPCPAVTITPSYVQAAICPGVSGSFVETVTNVTGSSDDINLSKTASLFNTTLNPASFTALGPFQSAVTTVTVDVPWSAIPGTTDVVTVTASGVNSGLSGQARLETTVAVFGSTWQDKAASPKGARYSAVVYHNGSLYQIGGENPASTAISDTFRYDIGTNTWVTLTGMITRAYGIDAVAINDNLYVAGGYNGTTYLDSLQVYSTTANTWGTAAPMPTPLAYYQAVALNGKLYVLGGFGGLVTPAVSNAVHVYDPATNAWSTVAPMSTPRYYAQAGVIGGQIYVAGGYSGAVTIAAGEVYSPAANVWTPIAAMPLPWVQGGDAVMNDRYLVISGGYSTTLTAAIYGWTYDAQTNAWTALPDRATLRYGAEADTDGTNYYLVAGRESVNSVFIMSARNEVLAVCPTCTPPSGARFTTNPITPQANEPITFTGSATGSGPLTYAWNFGDGATGSGNPIVHTYSTPAAYTVMMTVTGPCGSPVVYTGTVQLGQQAITFVYYDLEDVVQPGESVALAGSFNGWNSNANLMMPDAGYTTFTATLGVFPGTYDYKYIVKSGGDQWDWLNTDNRAITVTTSATVNDYRNVKVGYAVLVGPSSTTIELGQPTGPITGELYINNVTNPAGMGRGIAAQVGYGTSSDPSVWAWTNSAYVTNNGNNDVFAGPLTPMATGVYSYAVRYDGNWGAGNPHASWVYGDLDGVFPGNGFNINNVGVLNVTCTPPSNPAFDYTPAAPLVNQTVTFTGTASGTAPLTYTWDFGDGGTGSGNPATHSYVLGNVQTVTMTVAGQCGAPVGYTRNVTVTGTPDILVAPTSFNVTLSQGQTATRTLTITNVGNGLLTYSFTTTTAAPWLILPASGNVPAGSAPASLTLTFDTTSLTPNTYFTTLQVQSNDPDQPTINVTIILNVVCDPPTGVDFTYTPAQPVVGSIVTFSATVAAGSTPITYGWNFGDGSSAGSGQVVTHTFPMTALLKSYTVAVTAANACSSGVQVSKSVTIWPRMLYLPLIRKN
jgi:uncharacterized repeat protein (TIGR01451 family)